MFTLTVAPAYGLVVIGAGIGPFVTNIFLSGAVMKGRKEYNVQYPNCYATPGYHKNADEFNRIQRSHQNFLEGLDQYIVMTLLGGLKYPIACSVGCKCPSWNHRLGCLPMLLYQDLPCCYFVSIS
jgi:glutathione S-transferase